jgi:hypothetical protein
MHALGFSSGVWQRYFRDPETGKQYVPTASFQERGETVQKFVSPNTLKKGQEYFNCGSLNGCVLLYHKIFCQPIFLLSRNFKFQALEKLK